MGGNHATSSVQKILSSYGKYRVSDISDSVIRRMTRINNRYDSINLSQGFPDFDPPKQLLNEAIRRLEKLSALLA